MVDKDWDLEEVEEELDEKLTKTKEQKKVVEEVKEAAVKLFDDVDLSSVDTEGTDFVDIFGPDKTVDDFILCDAKLAVLGRAILESSEGSVRDRLFNYGFELSDVDTILTYVVKFLSTSSSVDVGGQYFSGEAKDLINPDTLSEIEDLFGGGKDDKKASKKSKAAPTSKKYDNPIDEVYSMLIEGQKLPIIYVQQFVGTEENFNKLLAMPGIKKTEYYVFYDEENMPVDETTELKNRYIK
jgi:hypothetical protein